MSGFEMSSSEMSGSEMSCTEMSSTEMSDIFLLKFKYGVYHGMAFSIL